MSEKRPILQVREVPVHIYCQLQDRAAKARRSLAQETLVTIERGLGQAGELRERREAVLNRIRDRAAKRQGKALPKPANLLREDRER